MAKMNLTVPIQVNLDTDKVVEKLIEMDYAPVVHGHWEYWAGSLVKCSVCGHEYTDRLECDDYCGNCGAKMDGDE